ncbi:permease [Clostridium sp. 19966]|uniref:permease n=1 Tax=Clostridium sp. 19966 TaxID=2768166 RepID=UPI0028DD4F08|nr:permease [Clostridium sp. 19966]MDT8717753.1 permease [Clostridium sp. 19966]
MKKSVYVEAILIASLVYLVSEFGSTNIGFLFDGGSVENARAFVIQDAIIFLTAVIAFLAI